MIRFGIVLTGVILLGACCSTPSEPAPGWFGYTNTAQRYSETQLQDAQKSALLHYQNNPDDESRMKLALLLIQGNPSRQQLDRCLELTEQISADGIWAAQRNLLRHDVQDMIDLQITRGRVQELESQLETSKTKLEAVEAQLETSKTKLEAVEAQLEAMKDIETRMTKEIDPDRKEQK